jgi:hypothetical protein
MATGKAFPERIVRRDREPDDSTIVGTWRPGRLELHVDGWPRDPDQDPGLPGPGRLCTREREAEVVVARERAARQRVAGGFAQNYDYALQVLTDLRYNAWRELDPEESL